MPERNTPRWRVYKEPSQFWYAQMYGSAVRIVTTSASMAHWLIGEYLALKPEVLTLPIPAPGGKLELPEDHCENCQQRVPNWQDAWVEEVQGGGFVRATYTRTCPLCGDEEKVSV